MKKILLPLLTIFSAGMVIIVSCSKNPSPAPPPPPPPPAKPVFTNLKSDTAWYNNDANIDYATQNTTSTKRPDGTTGGSSGTWTSPNITSSTNFVFTAIGPGGTVDSSIIANVWSQNMTFVCHYGDWQKYEDIYFNVVDSLNPAVWIYNTLTYDKFRYYPNNNRYEKYSSTGVYLEFGTWYWLATETQIRYGGTGSTDIWKVDTLNVNKLVITRDIPNLSNPNIIYRHIRKYIHA